MSLDVLTQAAVDHIGSAGVPCGRGVQPDAVGWTSVPGQSAFVPFSVLWRIGSLDVRSYYLDGRFNEWRLLLFVRCFGADAAQADQTLDLVRMRMLDQQLSVAGFSTVRLWLDNSQSTTRSEDTEVPMFEAGDFYRLWAVADPDGES